jgi:integrase
MKKKKRLWSVPRIKHPKFPAYTVRIGEYQPGGTLHVFRWVNGKQTSRALKCRLADLGTTTKAQVQEARRLGCEFIEELAARPRTTEAGGRPNAPLTLSQLADKYEVDGFAGRTAAYKRDALSSLRRVGSYLGADQPVGELKPSAIQKYLAHRIGQGHAPAGRGDLVTLSIACNWAVGEGLLNENPLATKRARDAMRINHEHARPVADADRYTKLLAKAPQLPPEFGVLLEMAWHTGHRISAILGLRWQDMSFEQTSDAPHGTVRWYSAALRDHKKHDHTLPMNEPARTALLAWQKRSAGIGAAWVFASPTDSTKPLAKWCAKRWLRKAEQLAELPHVKMGGWHMFRRGWATARKHMPLKDVAAGGGWTDTATVAKCYQHADEETTRRVVTFVA